MLTTTYVNTLTTMGQHANGRAGEIFHAVIKARGKDSEGNDLPPFVQITIDWEAFCSAFVGETGPHVKRVPGDEAVSWSIEKGGITYVSTQPIDAPTDPTVPAF